MSRNRIIYQNEAVFVGPSFVEGTSYPTPISTNLDRVQSINYDFSYDRSSLPTLGKGGSVDQPISSSPRTSVTINYQLGSLHNELALGFHVTPLGSASKISPINDFAIESNRTYDRKNLYLATMPEGQDAIGADGNNVESVLSFNDCQVDSYSVNFAVGEIPNGSVSLVGIDANYYDVDPSFSVPILNKKTALSTSGISVTGVPVAKSQSDTVFVPGNISVSISNPSSNSTFVDVANNKVQNFECNFSVNRTNVDLPGYKITYDKLLNFPIGGQASISLIEDGHDSGSLSSLIRHDDEYDINIDIKDGSGAKKMSYIFLKTKMQNIDSSLSIGDNRLINLNFSYELDPDNKSKGLFISGQT